MNLLEYTKKIAEQIAYYDKLIQNKYNFFQKPQEIIVIWVED